MVLAQIDPATSIQQAFEVSPLVGFLVTMNVVFIVGIIALYKDRNKIVDLNMSMARDSIKAITIVTESQNGISLLSKESLTEVRELKEAIIRSSCKYEKSS